MLQRSCPWTTRSDLGRLELPRNQVHRVTDGIDLIDVFIGNLDVEIVLEGDHDIDCKIDGIGQMGLKTEFVKKA